MDSIAGRILTLCHDCGASPGEYHAHGCDMEVCPRCEGQLIGCNCIYEINNINPDTLEDEHPDIYKNGPTQEMYYNWDRKYGNKRIKWNGVGHE